MHYLNQIRRLFEKKYLIVYFLSAEAWIPLEGKYSPESLEMLQKRMLRQPRGTEGLLHFRARPAGGWSNQGTTLHNNRLLKVHS